MAQRQIILQGKTYDVDAGSFTNKEGMDVERVCDMTFDQWNIQLAAGSMLAMTALVWILQKRENPNLRFSDVTFTLSEFTTVGGDDDTVAESSEVVPGGTAAEFDASDPTPAPEVSTDGASDTSESSPTSSE